MVVAGGLILYALGFWVPTLLSRRLGTALALVLLAGCAVVIVRSALHVPSRTHFDITREAGTATGVFLAVAPAVAIVFLSRTPDAPRGSVARLSFLALALCLSTAAGGLTFFAFPGG